MEDMTEAEVAEYSAYLDELYARQGTQELPEDF
jgi:hypothetical protein